MIGCQPPANGSEPGGIGSATDPIFCDDDPSQYPPTCKPTANHTYHDTILINPPSPARRDHTRLQKPENWPTTKSVTTSPALKIYAHAGNNLGTYPMTLATALNIDMTQVQFHRAPPVPHTLVTPCSSDSTSCGTFLLPSPHALNLIQNRVWPTLIQPHPPRAIHRPPYKQAPYNIHPLAPQHPFT